MFYDMFKVLTSEYESGSVGINQIMLEARRISYTEYVAMKGTITNAAYSADKITKYPMLGVINQQETNINTENTK